MVSYRLRAAYSVTLTDILLRHFYVYAEALFTCRSFLNADSQISTLKDGSRDCVPGEGFRGRAAPDGVWGKAPMQEKPR